MQEYKEIQIEVTKVHDAHKIAVRLKSCQDDYKTMKLELDKWFHCHQLVQLTNVAEHVICAARQRPSSNVGSCWYRATVLTPEDSEVGPDYETKLYVDMILHQYPISGICFGEINRRRQGITNVKERFIRSSREVLHKEILCILHPPITSSGS